MKESKELLRALEIYNETKDDSVVKAHYEALSRIMEYMNKEENKPKQEYVGCSKKYYYFLELPFEQLTMLSNGEYGFKQNGYNVIGKKEKDSKSYNLNSCLSLCNKTKEEMIKLAEKYIEQDNLESKGE